MRKHENLELFNEYIKCPSKENKDKIFESNYRIVANCVLKYFIKYTKFIPLDDMISDGLFLLYHKYIDKYANVVANNFWGRKPYGFYTYVKHNLQAKFLYRIRKICEHGKTVSIDDFLKDYPHEDDNVIALKYLSDKSDQYSKSIAKIDCEKEIGVFFKYLKPIEEKVIKMYFFEDLTFEQIASRLGSSKQNCHIAYQKAKAKLQKWTQDGITKEEIEKSKIDRFNPSQQLIEIAAPQLDENEKILAMYLLNKMTIAELSKRLGVNKLYCYELAKKLKTKLYYLNAELEKERC